MSKETPPPPGVSNLRPGGGREAISDVAPTPRRPQRSQPSARQSSNEVLRDANSFKLVTSAGTAPAGVTNRMRDVREGPMPATRTPKRNLATFTSVDGNTYSFRTHNPKGEPLPSRVTQCLFLCLVEMEKGGSPFTVMDAFKLRLEAADGAEIYPIPHDVLESLAMRIAGPTAHEPEETADSGFSLGE